MLSITPEYREAIQLHRSQGVRNASYARIYIGQFDASAAGDATATLLDNGTTRTVVPDTGFTAVQASDGSGNLSPALVLTITFGGLHRMSGITLQFGTVYATNFTLQTYLDDVLVVEHTITNTSAKYEGVLALENHDKMVITFTKLSAAASHLVLTQLLFGIGLTCDNEDIIKLTAKASNSPLSTELPNTSMDFTLYNENGIFDPDSSNSVLSFFSEDQKCALTFGYDVSGTGDIEWIPHSTRLMSAWSAAGIEARFKTDSILSRMTKTIYQRGKYGPFSIKALVDDIMLDYPDVAYDVSQYKMQAQYITEPLPLVSHAECLQLLANAAIATLEELPDGTIIMRERADIIPDYKVLSTGSELVILGSDVNDLTSTDPINEYAAWEQDGFALSGDMLFVPDDDASYVNTGVTWNTFPTLSVPSSQSQYQYPAPPVVRFGFTYEVTFGSVVLDFGDNFIPTYIGFFGFRWNGTSYDTVYKKLWKMLSKHMEIIDNFDRLSYLYVYMVGSDKQQRARIQRVAFSWENGYTLTADDIFDKPAGTRLPKCRNLTVSLVNRIAQTSAQFKEVTITAGTATWIEHGGVYKNVTAATPTAGATLTSLCYANASKITATGVTGNVVVRLTGQQMKDGAVKANVVAINTLGEDITITNPLLTSAALPTGYMDWVTEHMTRDIEWTANAIGYPEIQPADVIGYKASNVPAIVMETEITFSGGLREKIVLLKQGVT